MVASGLVIKPGAANLAIDIPVARPMKTITLDDQPLPAENPVLDPAQLDALGMWLGDADTAEIAAKLHLAGGAGEAARLVRSAVARLRRLTAPGAGNAGSKKKSTRAA